MLRSKFAAPVGLLAGFLFSGCGSALAPAPETKPEDAVKSALEVSKDSRFRFATPAGDKPK